MLSINRVRCCAALSSLMLLLGCKGEVGTPGAAGAQGTQGDPGPRGPAGEDGKQGPPGVVPPLTNDLSGTVTDGSVPLAGVSVTASPGSAEATTTSAGAFSLPGLAIGAYQLAFHLQGYLDQTVVVAVNLSGPTHLSVALALDRNAAVGPTVAVTDQLAVGYGAAVTVTASAAGAGPFTFAWAQLSGPEAAISGADTETLSFTTRDFASSLGPTALANARLGALGIDIDQANHYQFQVTVTDSRGIASTATVAVASTRPTSGLRMVPVGVPVWLQGNGPAYFIGTPPAPQTTWAWSLTSPEGSQASLSDPAAQFPHFVPDVVGVYTVTEAVSGADPLWAAPLKIYAGTWQGEMTDATQTTSCLLCHGTNLAPDKFSPWKGTRHYSVLQRSMEGLSGGQAFGRRCLRCHTLGDDPTAVNDGFDDAAASAGWSYPSSNQPGNWSALEAVPKLGDLAGIQCESCHGPQGFPGGPHAGSAGSSPDTAARISWSAEVCATCHAQLPQTYTTSQWRASKHADRSLALAEATAERSPMPQHCGRCHGAQSFARYAEGLAQGYYAYLTNDGRPLSPSNHTMTTAEAQAAGLSVAKIEALTCQACHDPHSAANPRQLRLYDAIAALPNGMTNVSGLGTGAICLACHNSRNGEHSDFATQAASASGTMGPGALTGFVAPHAAAQGDVLFGFNAYFGTRYDPSPHLAVKDSCAGCHVQIPLADQAAAGQTSNHGFAVDASVCAACHTSSVDGVALRAANRAQLDSLRSQFASKTLGPIAAALNAAPGATLVARAYDPSTGLYSSTSSSQLNVVINSVPTQIDYQAIGYDAYGATAIVGLTLHLPTPVTVQFVNPDGSANGSPRQVSNLSMPLSSLKLPKPPSGTQLTPFTAPTANAADVQVLYKTYWNMMLLNNDNTFGLHNPPFYRSVVAATSTRLAVLP